MTVFRIATFVNDEEHYSAMRASFEASGFTAPLARYTIETGEPYAGITRLGQAVEPYVLLVHQDVRCDRGDTASALQARLDELTESDSKWIVAGNAGRCLGSPTAEHLAPVRNISDPHGTTWSPELPKKVVSLDENLLILRTAGKPRCSPELSGWHLYGPDVALNAALAGGSAYVVDFRVTHLSAGNPGGFIVSSRRFSEHWRSRADALSADDPAHASLASMLSFLARFEAKAKRRA
ncbi:MAG TPA: hypothetical protein VF085_03980 [Solirubrobacterales bacterium]